MANEGFLGAFARIAGNFVGGSPDGPRHAWNAVAPWITDLTRSATELWLPHLVHGISCEVVYRAPGAARALRCDGHAIAACSVCRKPCCLNHSFVSRAGQAVCFVCVSLAANEAPRAPSKSPPPPPPPPSDEAEKARVALAEAYAVLGVEPGAPWAQIEEAYKALLRKYHPDRNRKNPRAAEKRFVRVRVAYDFLKAHEVRS